MFIACDVALWGRMKITDGHQRCLQKRGGGGVHVGVTDNPGVAQQNKKICFPDVWLILNGLGKLKWGATSVLEVIIASPGPSLVAPLMDIKHQKKQQSVPFEENLGLAEMTVPCPTHFI